MKFSYRNILFFLLAVLMLVPAAPVWADVQELTIADFAGGEGDVVKWGNMVKSLMSWGMWKLLLGGLETTMIIFVFSAVLSVLLGAGLAYLGISKRCEWLFKPLDWFVNTVHDIPSVALMMFFYFVLFAGEMNGIAVSIIALSVYTSGSLMNIFTIHIQQVGRGQIDAGLALGLTKRQCFRYIVLPQALKSMMPLFISEMKTMLLATSYAGYVAQEDLIMAVYSVREQYSDTFLPLLLVSIMYLVLSWLIAKIMQLLCDKFCKA